MSFVVDRWVIDHSVSPAIPSDGQLEVTITDFGGQVGHAGNYVHFFALAVGLPVRI